MAVMKFEPQDKMNRFEMAKAYQTLSPLNFMRMLLKIREIAKDKGVVFLIKQIIKEIKEHMSFATVSHLKGSLSRKEDDVSYDHYDFTKTSTYDAQTKALFEMIGLDDVYFDPTIQAQYKVLKQLFSSEELLDAKISPRGFFVVGGREYRVMSESEHEGFLSFLTDYFAEHGKDDDAQIRSTSILGETSFVVRTDNAVYKAFEESIGQKPFPKEEVSQEVETPKEIDTSYRRIPEEEQIKTHKALESIAKLKPSDLSKITCNINAAKALVLGQSKSGSYYVKLPGARLNATDPLKDMVICIPKKDIYKEFKSGGISFNVRMDTIWYRFNEANESGKFTPYVENGEQGYISALDLVKCFNINNLRSLTELDMNAEVYIDGQPMQLTEIGDFKYAYNSERAVVLSYSGEEKSLLIPSTIRVAGTDIPVKEVKDGAFADNEHLVEVTFSDNLNEVCNGAFSRCRNLQTVNNAENVRSWGDRVFLDCASLKSATLTSFVKTIGTNIFEGCLGMEEFKVKGDNGQVVLKDGALYVGDGQLYAYPPAKMDGSITIDANTVLAGAFKNSQVEEVFFNKDCLIQTGAFEDCVNLKGIDANGQLTIESSAFTGSNLTKLPENSVLLDKDVVKGTPLEEKQEQKTKPAQGIDFEPDMGH